MNTRTSAVTAALLLCGMLTVTGSADAMTNGIPVIDPAAAPWVATLAPPGDGPLLDTAGCGGALVTPDRVVTAARCVDGKDPSRLQVHLDAQVLSEQPGTIRGVRGIAVLPGYRVLPSPIAPEDKDFSSANFDLAVILLDRPVTEVPILPVARSATEPGGAVAMFSHGLTGRPDPADRDDLLHRGDLTVISHTSCAQSTPATVDRQSVVCAQDRARGAVAGCWLDGGSPAVSFAEGRPELVGTFSFGGESAGRDCVPPAPAAFTDAAAFRQWILGPLPEREPYPTGPATLTRTGNALRCRVPQWDRTRGQAPASVDTAWVALEHRGPNIRQLPIDGVNTPQLRITDDLKGLEVACAVRARSSGGSIALLSPSLVITP